VVSGLITEQEAEDAVACQFRPVIESVAKPVANTQLRFKVGDWVTLARPPENPVRGFCEVQDYLQRQGEIARIKDDLYHLRVVDGPEFWVSDNMLDPIHEVTKVGGRFTKPAGRRYLPTLSDLVDRLTIVQLKMIFIPEHKEAYLKEREDIEHDIDLIILEKKLQFDANAIHAVIMLMLCNRFIWENESRARAGGNEQDKLLKLTHSINGIRNASKNKLAQIDGGRRDYKVDALAADLPPEFGNWSVF
jgi:hypothetical protein